MTQPSRISYEIVTDGGRSSAGIPIDEFVTSAKMVLRRAVVGDMPIPSVDAPGQPHRPWSMNLEPTVVEAVRSMPVDAIIDQRFMDVLADATSALAESGSLRPGAVSNLRATASDARRSIDLGFVSAELLRDLAWLGIAAREDVRDEEMGDFLSMRNSDIHLPIRSNVVSYAMRNPAKAGAIAVVAAIGIGYAIRRLA